MDDLSSSGDSMGPPPGQGPVPVNHGGRGAAGTGAPRYAPLQMGYGQGAMHEGRPQAVMAGGGGGRRKPTLSDLQKFKGGAARGTAVAPGVSGGTVPGGAGAGAPMGAPMGIPVAPLAAQNPAAAGAPQQPLDAEQAELEQLRAAVAEQQRLQQQRYQQQPPMVGQQPPEHQGYPVPGGGEGYPPPMAHANAYPAAVGYPAPGHGYPPQAYPGYPSPGAPVHADQGAAPGPGDPYGGTGVMPGASPGGGGYAEDMLPQRRPVRTDPSTMRNRPPFDVTASGRRRHQQQPGRYDEDEDYFPPMGDFSGGSPGRRRRGRNMGNPNARHTKNNGRGNGARRRGGPGGRGGGRRRPMPATAEKWPLRTSMDAAVSDLEESPAAKVPAYARRRAREVEYKPYTLDDYKQLQATAPKKMGHLGPDLASPKLRERQERRKKMKRYGERVKAMHQQHIPAPIVPRGSLKKERELSKSERAAQYAKTIRKPTRKAAPRQQKGASNAYVTAGYGGTYGYGVGAGARGGGYELNENASSKYRSAAEQQLNAHNPLEAMQLKHRLDLDQVARIRQEYA